MSRTIRYQAAILHEDHVLLIKAWDHVGDGARFWLIPGGGREPGESEEACVVREAFEETQLEVVVERLLYEEADFPGSMYQRLRTYACRVVRGVAQPGTEPEVDTADRVTIQEVRWFDLRDERAWDAMVLNDPITYPRLQRLRMALGYGANEPAA